MQFSLIGINHQTAPVAILEKVAISAESLADTLSLLCSHIPQGIILSTCNRTEIYTVTDDDGDDTKRATLDFLKGMLGSPDDDLLRYVYVYRDTDAARHLFRVASGLESMVVGEYEVLGQVKQALEIAEKTGTVNLPLRHAFQSAIRTGRLVREQTGISRNALSVSSIAVDLAANIIGDLKKCRMLVIGAGEAGTLAARAAKERGVSQIGVVSRTHDRASKLAADLGGTPISLNSIAEELATSDLVITCADAPQHLLDVALVEAAMRQHLESPLVIIDIAVPRNVTSAVSQVNNVFLYNIDDLNSISERNRKQREGEIEKAGEIIADKVKEFFAWWQDLEVRPVVTALMKKAEDIRRSHLTRTLKKLPPLSEEEQYSLEMMTRAIVAKILREPIHSLKVNGHGPGYAEMVRELFNLDADKRG
jgi:glutamyl-tRNA reductase